MRRLRTPLPGVPVADVQAVVPDIARAALGVEVVEAVIEAARVAVLAVKAVVVLV